jgi:hypothetical protein
MGASDRIETVSRLASVDPEQTYEQPESGPSTECTAAAVLSGSELSQRAIGRPLAYHPEPILLRADEAIK